ncbi:MAG: YtxH domain-containing protein [Nitrospirota bacterium]
MSREHCTHSSLAVVLAFLLGGLFGVGIAILVAPVPGEQTRRRLKEAAEEIKDHTVHYVDETKGRVAAIIEKGKELTEETLADLAGSCACTRDMKDKGNGAA